MFFLFYVVWKRGGEILPFFFLLKRKIMKIIKNKITDVFIEFKRNLYDHHYHQLVILNISEIHEMFILFKHDENCEVSQYYYEHKNK